MLESSQLHAARSTSRILLNLFDLEAITVDDVMVPRNQIEAIDLDAPLEQIRAADRHRSPPAAAGLPRPASTRWSARCRCATC